MESNDILCVTATQLNRLKERAEKAEEKVKQLTSLIDEIRVCIDNMLSADSLSEHSKSVEKILSLLDNK